MSELEGMPDLSNLTPDQWEQLGLSPEEFNAEMAKMVEREKLAPCVGDPAPDFQIKRLSKDGNLTGESVRLSDLRGRPVALVFGSYT